VSRAFRKSLEAILERHSSSDAESLETVSALVTRWILVIKFVLRGIH